MISNRATGEARAQMTPHEQFLLNIPETVSKEAQEFLRSLKDPSLTPPFPQPGDVVGWKKLRESVETDGRIQSEAIVKHYVPTITEYMLGGIPVLDVRPKGWRENGKVVVYTHGGAHVMYSAESTLGRAVIFASDTGHRVISVDYTLAPEAKFNQITEQIVTVYQALLKDDHRFEDILSYGDSFGGGLAASVILKMRDQRLGMPAAAVLVSPWVDVTRTGDTEFTLQHAEPNYLYDQHSKNAAGAYADPKDQKHPYVSPVYGDYSKGFPPTLIQGGTRELFLSHFVRQYRAIDGAGGTAVLDLYDGMPHVFQMRRQLADAPETEAAMKKM